MKPLLITLVIMTNVLNFELALDKKQQEIGLMGRKSWGKIDGMLFIHEKPSQVAYWMKDTYLEMYMIFFDSNLKAKEIYKPKPLSTEVIFTSNKNIKYVLELNTKYSNFTKGEDLELLSKKLRLKLKELEVF